MCSGANILDVSWLGVRRAIAEGTAERAMVPPKGELKQQLRATTAHLNVRLLQHSQHSAEQTDHIDFEQ